MDELGIGILVVLFLGLAVLVILGLVSVARSLTGSAPKGSGPDPGSLEELQRTLREHEVRLRKLENMAPAPRTASPLERTETPVPSVPSKRTASPSPEPTSSTRKRSSKDKGLEEAIAGRWFQWIALAALLFGLAYFLKLAFENNWIGPLGRVSMGWAAGILFLALGRRWSDRYPGWAQSLAGGGLSFLYLSTYAAFQFYHLIGNGTAFALMILTTVVGSILAARDKSLSLAAGAAAGGFLTPALVSTGEDHQVILMSYLMILDIGVFFLSSIGRWRYLRWGAAFFTLVYCSEYAAHFYDKEKLWLSLGFHTAFYLLFAFSSWLQDFRDRKDADTADALFTVLSAAVYYATSYGMLADPAFNGSHDLLTALLALGLAALYAWQSSRLAKSGNDQADYLSDILLGLAGAFFAVAVPAYMSKHWITVGWSAEAFFLVWAGLRSGRPFTRILGYIALGLATVRLLVWDWVGLTPTLFWNDRLIPYGAVLSCVVAVILLVGRWKPKPVERETALPILAIGGNLTALLYLSLEVADYWNRQPAAPWNAKALSLSVLWLLYAGGMMTAGFVKDIKGLRLVAILTFWITILKVFFYDLSELQGVYRVLSLILLGSILLAVSFAYQRKGKRTAAAD